MEKADFRDIMIFNSNNKIPFETVQIKSHSAWVKTKEPE